MEMIKVYEAEGLFLNINFGLVDPETGETWCSDSDMRDFLYTRYMLYNLSIPRVDITAKYLQLTADLIRERYNKMYHNLHLEFNPLYNVDAWEEYDTNRDGDNKSEGNAKEYPMNSNTSRPVSTTDGKGDFREHTIERRRRYGNIGVTKSTELIADANKILRDLIDDYMNEFGDWFMLNTWGEW